MRYLAGIILVSAAVAPSAMAAESNDAAARKAEEERLTRIDPPVRPDPVGNALIGGAVSGAISGPVAGVATFVRQAVTGSAIELGREKMKQNQK
jgi:hypothetical protein